MQSADELHKRWLRLFALNVGILEKAWPHHTTDYVVEQALRYSTHLERKLIAAYRREAPPEAVGPGFDDDLRRILRSNAWREFVPAVRRRREKSRPSA